MNFTYAEARDLLDLFGDPDPDSLDMEIKVLDVGSDEKSHSGPGKYAYYAEYPDEGTMLLGHGKKIKIANKSLHVDRQKDGGE